MSKSLSLCLVAAALALGGCNQSASDNAATGQPGAAQDKGGGQTIAQTIEQNSKFFQAAKAVGLDSTLAGTGPYTVLVPDDAAFAKVQGSPLADTANAQNRAEITRILTYHILPGVILADDIKKAIDSGNGKTVLATMGGETLTATSDGGKIVLADAAGGKATITRADIRASNGVIQEVDAVLAPPKGGASGPAAAPAQNSGG